MTLVPRPYTKDDRKGKQREGMGEIDIPSTSRPPASAQIWPSKISFPRCLFPPPQNATPLPSAPQTAPPHAHHPLHPQIQNFTHLLPIPLYCPPLPVPPCLPPRPTPTSLRLPPPLLLLRLNHRQNTSQSHLPRLQSPRHFPPLPLSHGPMRTAMDLELAPPLREFPLHQTHSDSVDNPHFHLVFSN